MLKESDIKIIVSNKPTKEKSDEKIKELCKVLAMIWQAENG